jgi:hypothetical protein
MYEVIYKQIQHSGTESEPKIFGKYFSYVEAFRVYESLEGYIDKFGNILHALIVDDTKEYLSKYCL